MAIHIHTPVTNPSIPYRFLLFIQPCRRRGRTGKRRQHGKKDEDTSIIVFLLKARGAVWLAVSIRGPPVNRSPCRTIEIPRPIPAEREEKRIHLWTVVYHVPVASEKYRSNEKSSDRKRVLRLIGIWYPTGGNINVESSVEMCSDWNSRDSLNT